jgi:hypothetical protein
VDDFAFVEIHHANGVVSKLRHEQAISGRIERHVIDPAADLSEIDLVFEDQRWRIV